MGVLGVLGCGCGGEWRCWICVVSVCISVYGWRWSVGGWWCVETEALRVVGMFGVWWLWVCLVHEV